MAKENKTVTSSTKEELVMYLLLFVGVSAIVSLFAVNVVLINKIFGNTFTENQYLRQILEYEKTRSSEESPDVFETTEGDFFVDESDGSDLPDGTDEGSGLEDIDSLDETTDDSLEDLSDMVE